MTFIAPAFNLKSADEEKSETGQAVQVGPVRLVPRYVYSRGVAQASADMQEAAQARASEREGGIKRMAVQFESSEQIQRGSAYFIATQDIDIDAENNGRHVLPNIDWLVASIRSDGQKVPCVVGKNGKRAKMIEGHSRWRAICEINKGRNPEERLKVWCVYFEGNEVDALVTGFTANRERNALTPVDEGYFVARMQRFSKTLEQIAAICHEDVAWCKQRLALVSLTPEAQEAVADGTVKITAAVALSKLAASEQRRHLKSGKTLSAAGIKAESAPAKQKRAGLPEVKEILRAMVNSGQVPKEFTEAGLKSTGSSGDTLHLFCGLLLDMLSSKPKGAQKAA